MIALEHGRRYLRQWDLDRRVQIDNFPPGTWVEIYHLIDGKSSALVVEAYEEDGRVYANIPNALLQTFGYLRICVRPSATDTEHAPEEKDIKVVRTEKPEGYIYHETETLSYKTLEDRILKLENDLEDQAADALEKYLQENPIAGTLPVVTEADNGKIAQVVGGRWVAAELPVYDGEHVVVPSAEAEQTLPTAQTFMNADIKVKKIPVFDVSNNAGGITVYIASDLFDGPDEPDTPDTPDEPDDPIIPEEPDYIAVLGVAMLGELELGCGLQDEPITPEEASFTATLGVAKLGELQLGSY